MANHFNSKEQAPSHWAREPWFWIVMAPLILVFIASIFTVSLAFYGADDVISDNYYKEGRMLAQPNTAEAHAASLNLSAELEITHTEVRVKLNQVVQQRSLQLLISHPAKADLDITLDLKKFGYQDFRAQLPEKMDGRWYLRITAYDADAESWRLHGEVDLGSANTTELQ